MRIIAGSLGGRQFEPSKSRRTHPMGDKVRGGLFNTLGDITGLSVLDAFAGTGALSFEAASRGAEFVVAVDIDPDAHAAINKNIRVLELRNKIKSTRANVSSWADNNSSASFDIVICDPPYDDIPPELLIKLAGHADIGGVIVFSLPPRMSLKLSADSYQLLANKSYGDAQLVFYRKIA